MSLQMQMAIVPLVEGTPPPNRERILAFIHAYYDSCGIGLSIDEIGRELGIPRMTVYYHVNKLEAQGYLRKRPYGPHGPRRPARSIVPAPVKEKAA